MLSSEPLFLVPLNPCSTASQPYSRRVVQSRQALDSRRPRIKCEGNLARGFVHTLANLFLCYVRALKNIRTKGLAVQNILLGKGRPAEFEEAAKPTTLN